MRAFLYCRYSSQRQQELSIEGQRDVCAKYAQDHGINVVGEYVDRAKSGRSGNREGFQRLIRDASTGIVDIILVWKYDRFFRDRAESALYRRDLERAGVRLISVTEAIPEGSAGVVTQGMIETVSEYFSAKLSEDVTRGMQKAAEHCRVTGGAILGYKAGDDKRWHIDPIGAEIVQRAFEWYAAGKPLGELAAQLNAEGHRTAKGAEWTRTSFSTILRNEKYIGIYSYDDTVRVSGGMPRIIDDELFFQVRRRLDANRHRPGAYKAEVPYYLSGKLFCGLCGSPMTGTAGTSKSGVRHYYYICNNRRRKMCSKKNVRLDAIEQAVLTATMDMLTPENIAKISVEVERRALKDNENAALLASLKAQLEEVQRKIKNIGNAIAMGIITETTKEMLEDAEAQRSAIRDQIDRAKVQAALVVKAESVACWLDGFRHGDRNDPNFKRQVFSALVHAVYVYEDHLKIFFNTDGTETAEIPFSAIPATSPGPVTGSYLGGCGVPKSRSSPKGTACFLIVPEGTRTIKCGSPVDCRQTPAGRRLLHNVPSPFWRTPG